MRPLWGRLPFPFPQLHELWERRRFGRVASASDELTVRVAYGHLHAILGHRFSRERLRRMARQSQRMLRDTRFEISNPVLWGGFAFEGMEHLEAAVARGRGALIVSFHVGPYRFIPIELAHLGHRVDVVVDQRGVERETAVIETQADLVSRAIIDAQGRIAHWRADLLGRIDVINAEEPDVAMRMVRALRDRRLVMVYLDGNTGAGPRKTEHLARVPFMGTHVLVRQGIGKIAKVTGAPVIVALSWRRLVRRHVCRFSAPIEPAPGEPREEFSNRALGEAMALLAERLERDPGQWEEWHHLHRMHEEPAALPDRSHPEPSPELLAAPCAVDSYRAFAVSDGTAHFVFEPERRRFVRVSKLGFDLLRTMYEPRSVAELVALFGSSHGAQAVVEEVKRLATRGWLERSA